MEILFIVVRKFQDLPCSKGIQDWNLTMTNASFPYSWNVAVCGDLSFSKSVRVFKVSYDTLRNEMWGSCFDNDIAVEGRNSKKFSVLLMPHSYPLP